ncbi:antiviral reverse transcriptase Drt3b [Gilliamella sp. ESL0254]|uniref:antiviral reverse transcriptase Drt3b n=1 Tax=Gilliamella sp. ESL0254 TaxID=2705035 RepID=UPI001580DA17|nr:antiviral reverse transcriptase Drt3b [Gilliamella sp. ESL0254]NUF28002.1 RNA-directed DNA polymerase [Gilliamella sp. ESL0254]
MNKFIKLKYKKERCILSDTLPFEVPIIFNNKNFYDFILKNRIKFENTNGIKKISWINIHGSDALDYLIKILFNLKIDSTLEKIGNNRIYSKESKKFNSDTIPYNFKITHHSNIFRELSIPHPLTQLIIIDFYERYKELIIYYCSLSSFSIRKPVKVAQYIFYKDRTHYNQLVDNTYSNLELDEEESENLRSFFVYGDVSNIHAFYDSSLFHEQEKKYNNLMKLDISKCFDSIYTHSISWAINGFKQTKEAISLSAKTFAGAFDKLMQESNYNETNGIIIGPEISRIFAEIILQSIDLSIKQNLMDNGLIEGVNYNIFRYIDDYFVFYNNNSHKEILIQTIQDNIRKYKLNLNTSKLIDYQKPIITEMSIAKTKISSILNERLEFKLETVENDNLNLLEEKTTKGNIYINNDTLIRDFKIILKESNVEYKNILNYTLSIIERKIELIFKKYNKVSLQHKKQENLILSIRNILNFTFFVYTINPQVSPTIRLSRIIGKVLFFVKKSNLNKENQNIIEHFLYENICIVLDANRIKKHTHIETIYLLLSVSELGKEYSFSELRLASYFNIDLSQNENLHLSYFALITILFYIKDKKKYKQLHSIVVNSIKNKIIKNKNRRDSESILLLMDILSCPYVDINIKEELLKNNYGITDVSLLANMCNFKKHKKIQQWFTVWSNFDFLKELYVKHSREVY